MTKVKQRFFVKESGAIRHAHEYIYDPRDLDAAGNPPSWFLQPDHIEPDADEIEFDHVPGEGERLASFKWRKDHA